MIESARGIILRTRPLTETSLIVHWLTADHGRIATGAKGARRQNSSYAGKLDLFYEAEFTFSRSRRSELHTLREVNLRETNKRLREELHYLRQAAYAAALVEQTTETETPLPAVHELFREFLEVVPNHPPLPQTVFAFELKMLAELGQQPDVEGTSLTEGVRQLLNRLTSQAWPTLFQLKLSTPQVTEIRQFLHGFMIYHLGKIPPSRAKAITS
jgi:DNA repair protein RecO